MRRGLYWSTANIRKERGFVIQGLQRKDGWNHMRVYILEDLGQDHQGPEWVAELKVSSMTISTLRNFRLDWLSMESISAVGAWNWDNQCIYQYDAADPDVRFNAIYDDMPLDGVWPWPKASKI